MKQPLADESVLLDDCMEAALTWSGTEGQTAFWRAAGSHAQKVRVNDFPEDHLYTLLIDNQEIGNLDEWPPQWLRSGESK